MALPCHPLSPTYIRRLTDIIRTHDKVRTRLRPRPFIKNVVPKTGLEPVSLAAADFKSVILIDLLRYLILWTGYGQDFTTYSPETGLAPCDNQKSH